MPINTSVKNKNLERVFSLEIKMFHLIQMRAGSLHTRSLQLSREGNSHMINQRIPFFILTHNHTQSN